MISLHIKPIVDAQDVLSYVTIGIQNSPNWDRVTDTQAASLRGHIEALLEQLRGSDFDMSRQAVKRLLRTLGETDDAQRIMFDAADLRRRLLDQFDAVSCLYLPRSDCGFYEQEEPLFGNSVEMKFPNASEDIAEAGKCLALGRYTASIFHLMRVTELGVQKFGDSLGIQLAHELNWQNILDQINKKVKALDPKAPETKQFAEASSHLYHVKLAWRNEVMHPKQTYTEEEAREVFGATKSFMRDLCVLV